MMSELNRCDTCIYKIGYIGEGVIRDFLTRHKHPYMQADLIFKHNNQWFLAEVKRQDVFTPPPFLGHGLPLWQIERRLEIQGITGLRAVFFVVDKSTLVIYYNYLDVLYNDDVLRKPNEEIFFTKGANPEKRRVIFPLKNFKILKEKLEL